jgi:hypothetical protein
VSKKEHHQEEGGLAQDVKAQAQVSKKVEGRTVEERERSDERETVKWMDRDREGSDVSHPRGTRFAREEREGIGGENERKSLTGCEGMEVVM